MEERQNCYCIIFESDPANGVNPLTLGSGPIGPAFLSIQRIEVAFFSSKTKNGKKVSKKKNKTYTNLDWVWSEVLKIDQFSSYPCQRYKSFCSFLTSSWASHSPFETKLALIFSTERHKVSQMTTLHLLIYYTSYAFSFDIIIRQIWRRDLYFLRLISSVTFWRRLKSESHKKRPRKEKLSWSLSSHYYLQIVTK